jgi:hypothetical protein
MNEYLSEMTPFANINLLLIGSEAQSSADELQIIDTFVLVVRARRTSVKPSTRYCYLRAAAALP